MATGGGTIEMRQTQRDPKACLVCEGDADFTLKPVDMSLCKDCHSSMEQSEKEAT